MPDVITQPELLDMPNTERPEVEMPERSATLRGLARMKAEHEAAAKAVPFSDEEIAAWLERNIEALADEHARVLDAIKKGRKSLRGARPDNPNWPRWYELRGREQYVEESIRAVNQAGKPAACLSHGVAGVPELTEQHYEGAYWHPGCLGRYCSACQKSTAVQTYARRIRESEATE